MRIHAPGLLILLLAAAPAAAQHPLGHPLPDAVPGVRPLHERLPRADAAAIAVVERVDPGRLEVAEAVAVLGELPERFAVKRRPSTPPPLQRGDRAVLLLRGARPPYVLVDEPSEVLVLESPADATRWLAALSELDAAQPDPDRLVALYGEWLEGPSATLRRAALAGLADERPGFRPLPDDVVERIVELAVAPDAEHATRLRAAVLASAVPEAQDVLLARLPGGAGADVEVLGAALRRGLLTRHPGTAGAVERALAHDDPSVRKAALGLTVSLARQPGIVAAVTRLAASDPDEGVRAAAERALARLRREGASARGRPLQPRAR